MADAKGIRRLVQLVLDKASAARLKKDMGDALDKGTDPAQAKKNLSAVEGGLAKLKTAALALGAALAAAFAVKKLWNFAKETVKTAEDADAIWNRLAQAVNGSGVAWESVEKRIHAVADAFQDVSTVGDEDFAMVLTELITTSGKFEESLRNVSLVADLAAAKQIDLRSAAMLVGRAMVGQTATLTRYGIVVQQGQDAIEVMRQKFAGFAENEAKTFQGRMIQLTNAWQDFKQALGEAITKSESVQGSIHKITLVVKEMTKWVNDNRDSIQQMGQGLLGLGRIVALIAAPLTASLAGLVKLFGLVLQGAEKLFRGMSMFEGIMGRADKAAAFKNMADSIDGLGESLREAGDGILTAAGALAKLATAQVQAQGPTHEMIDLLTHEEIQARKTAAAVAAANATVIGKPNQNEPVPHPQTGPGITAEPLTLSLRTRMFDIESARLAEIASQRAQEMMSIMTSAAYTIEDAWAGAFQSAAEGMTSLGQLAGSVGWAIAAGLANGLAMLYEGKAAAAIAEGIMGNAAGFAAAIKFTAAAAIFRALQGIAGSHARGGGGPSAYAGTTASGAPNIGGSPATEINIYIDPMNPDNPLHQRVVKRTIDQATQRYGNQTPAKVTVHSGSRP